MNILELRPNPNSMSNGIDRYCNALRNLFKEDDNVYILPIKNYPMKKGKILKERYNKETLKSVINNEEIDIVHINGFASFSVIQGFRYAKKAKKKIVYTAHWHPFEYLNHPLRAKIFFFLFLKPLIIKYADAVITINNEDTMFFKQFHHNVIQVPHWVDEQSVQSNNVERESSMILFVGRVNDPNKGSEHLFHLPEGKYDIHCVGPCVGNLRSDMTSHVNIPFEELNLLYAKASLLVVPSRYEAFSYAALEALSYGTPVLLSDRVRIADYLEGVKGVDVFQYHNYEDFELKVEQIIGKKVDIVKVREIFYLERIKQIYKNVYIQTYTGQM